jgi:O-antigen/teichoic acid export membrane protein
MKIYKKLSVNTLIFAFGNISSKIILFVMIPIYSHYLSPFEYGIIDTLSVTLMLLLPIVTLSIYESTLRYTVNNKGDTSSVISNSLFVSLLGLVILLLFSPLLLLLRFDIYLIILMYFVLIFQSLNQILMSYARGKNKVIVYSLAGLINSIFVMGFSLLFIIVLKWNIEGYYFSIIAGSFVSIIIIVFTLKLYQHVSFKYLDKKLLKEMLIFSLPLVPNALMWWFMNVSDRYVILIYMGFAANGIYAIANKFPTFIALVHTIFFQAWQITVIEENENSNIKMIFSNIFNLFAAAMMILAAILIFSIKDIYLILIDNEYLLGWKITPLLIGSAIFFGFSSFLGSIYVITKKTKGALYTSILGALVNIILNIILIPIIGLLGAALATLLGSFTMFAIRLYDTRRYLKFKINYYTAVLSIFLIILQTLLILNEVPNSGFLSLIPLLTVIIINMFYIYFKIKSMINNTNERKI